MQQTPLLLLASDAPCHKSYHASWQLMTYTHTHLTTHFSRTTRVSQYQKGKTNLDFTEARDSEWQWHQLDHMQVCTSIQTDNHASTPPLSFLQAGCSSCCPTNSVKALKAADDITMKIHYYSQQSVQQKSAGIDMQRNYVNVTLRIN